MRKVERQQPTAAQAQKHQEDAALQRLHRNVPVAQPARTALRAREREADARHEEKQREDEIHEMKAVPRGMAERRLEPIKPERGGECAKKPFATHDEQHVETAQRVKRRQANGCGLLLFGIHR